MSAMKTSAVGIALIKRFEGFCAAVYNCPAGKLTIGYGNVVKPGQRFGTLTEAQATDLLNPSLTPFPYFAKFITLSH